MRRLGDLIKVFAEKYVYLGRILQWWMHKPGGSDNQLSDEHLGTYSGNLKELKVICGQLSLFVSGRLFLNTLETLEDRPRPTYDEVADRIAHLHECLDAELNSQFFFFVPPHRAEYMSVFDDNATKGELTEVGKEIARFLDVIRIFPGIIFDLEEAGNCFATGSFTACVFHLMRICELGLVSLATDLGIDAGISSWEGILKQIHIKIGELDQNHPEGWKDKRVFYSESAALMLGVKNAWRNSVSHIRRTYDEPRARRIFNSVEALMAHLSTRLTEKEIPTSSVLSEPDIPPEGATHAVSAKR